MLGEIDVYHGLSFSTEGMVGSWENGVVLYQPRGWQRSKHTAALVTPLMHSASVSVAQRYDSLSSPCSSIFLVVSYP